MSSVPREQGFSLIEMIVVMAIFSLALVISIPYVKGSGNALTLDAETRILAARLREARLTAMLNRMPASLVIQLQPPGFSGPGRRPFHALPKAIQLQVVTAKGLVKGDSAVILFSADGGSTGGEIKVSSLNTTRTIRVNWLTGAVETLGRSAP